MNWKNKMKDGWEGVGSIFWLFILPILFMIGLGRGWIGSVPYESRKIGAFICLFIYIAFWLTTSTNEKSYSEVSDDKLILLFPGIVVLIVSFAILA